MRYQKQEKRVLGSSIFSAGDSLGSVWGALLCCGCACLPTGGQSPGAARICRLRTKAQVTLEFLYAELQAEGGDALTLQVDDAGAMKKIGTASGCAELNFDGTVNPSGAAGRTEFPGAADPHLNTRAAGAEHPLGSHQQNCSAIPTSGLPGAVQSLGVQFTPGRWITPRYKWAPEL